mgnify:CR=1 FL=1
MPLREHLDVVVGIRREQLPRELGRSGKFWLIMTAYFLSVLLGVLLSQAGLAGYTESGALSLPFVVAVSLAGTLFFTVPTEQSMTRAISSTGIPSRWWRVTTAR